MGEHPVLFIPGPTEVLQELREILARPLCGHRSQAFVETVKSTCTALQGLFRTSGPAAFETCPATALMEAAIRNLVPRGGATLHLTCGAFGERWAVIADACGRKPHRLEAPWGSAHDPAALRERLLTSPPYEAVCITHNETSTGVIEPLRELAAVVREISPETLVLADVVTSLAGAPLEFEAWGLDCAFAGTQKCLALAPGLTVYAVSQRALERARRVPERGMLFDFVQAVPETMAGKTLATPCIPLVFALAAQLERIRKETLEARWRRHVAMQHETFAWAQQWGFAPYVADPAVRSPTVSSLQASGRDVEAMARSARERGFQLDRGYGNLRDKTFRIGHMGDHTVDGLRRLLRAITV